MNTIYNTKYEHIYEIKLSWGDVQPVIYEMNISNNESLLPVTSISDLKDLVNQYEESEDISLEAAHKLNLHLKALEQFEKIGAADKVKKHLTGLKDLLDHQHAEGQISNQAYEALINGVDHLINE